LIKIAHKLYDKILFYTHNSDWNYCYKVTSPLEVILSIFVSHVAVCRGAQVEVKNKKGNSPLWLAANGGHLNVVELLYNAGADIDSQDNRKVLLFFSYPHSVLRTSKKSRKRLLNVTSNC
jgi:ankyrin repeat protein